MLELYGLLEKSVEEEAAVARATAVEAEGELVEVVVELLGSLVAAKIVPAVSEVSLRQEAQRQSPRESCHAFVARQDGQTKPSGQRRRAG